MVDLSHTLSTHWQENFTFFLHVFCCYFVPQLFQATSVYISIRFWRKKITEIQLASTSHLAKAFLSMNVESSTI